jgi:arylsulfatase A-like enzyme
LVVFAPKGGHPQIKTSEDPVVEPTIVELVDLMPTVTKLAQAASPANLPGTDLLSQLDGNANDGDSYAEFGDMLSLRQGDHLMMARLWMHGGTSMDPEITRRLKAAPNPGSTFLLHQVVVDPMQMSELARQEPDIARQMYDRLVEVRLGPGAPPGGGLSNEQVQALRSSGALNYW